MNLVKKYFATDDVRLLRNLRYENFEVYQEIIEMHLTRMGFNLLKEEMDALWPVESKNSIASDANLQLRTNPLEKVLRKFNFGKKNNQLLYQQRKLSKQEELKPVLFDLMKFLSKEEHLKHVGVFRRSGSVGRQSQLRDVLIRGDKIDSIVCRDTSWSIHDVTSLFKQVIGELQPLLSEPHYSVYVELAGWSKCTNDLSKLQLQSIRSRQTAAIHLLWMILPESTTILLLNLLQFLQRIASYHHINKMDASALSTIFVPHLFYPRSVKEVELLQNTELLSDLLAFMIGNADEIFEVPKQLSLDVRLYFSKKEVESTESSEDGVFVPTTFKFAVTQSYSKSDMTETEVARAYADIQMMPDGAEKRRLLKRVKELSHEKLRRSKLSEGQEKGHKRKTNDSSRIDSPSNQRLMRSGASSLDINLTNNGEKSDLSFGDVLNDCSTSTFPNASWTQNSLIAGNMTSDTIGSALNLNNHDPSESIVQSSPRLYTRRSINSPAARRKRARTLSRRRSRDPATIQSEYENATED